MLRIAFGAVVMLALFWRDWAAMADQWWNTATYNHALLVPLILFWLVWQRRTELVKLNTQCWWPGLVLFFGASFVWVLGAFSDLNLARQAGVVAMCASLVPLFAGPRVFAGLIFPLFYMIFLIPMGQELVPFLQTVTAHITIALVKLSGVDAVIDGVFIDTPAGLFEVAEACSGVMFLIAMLAFGAMMANICFKNNLRRAILMVACVAVPILANGVRAWGTIFAAQLFGVEVAVGFDHIVYGWFFFGFVLILVIAAAWRFFDREADDPIIDAQVINADPFLLKLSGMKMRGGIAVLSCLAVVLGMQGWAFAANRSEATLPSVIGLPDVPGWKRVDYAPQIWWEPKADGADHRLLGSYANEAGQRVDVFYALYSSQGEGREAGGFGQGALTPGSPWAWQADVDPVAGSYGVKLLGNGRTGRVAQTWYHNGGVFSGSNPRLKLAVMADRLSLQAQPTALLIISAEDTPINSADPAIRAFVEAASPLHAWVDGIGSVN